ncbi:MAG TPA: alpha/beta hydrolase [Myxococcota bacterium]|nr:alpha/beta hydrolase [Myxococcota bacterium]
MAKEAILRANGVDLCAQTFGRRRDPAILLIHGAAASMLAWEDDFCARLAAGSRFVVRYDHRDTGRSVGYPPGRPGYAMRDLMEDAIGLLDALDLPRGHLVGRSMGGGLAMGAALEHPERVASLTLLATSPGGPDLPPMSKEFLAFVTNPRQPDWSDPDAAADHVLTMLRIMAAGSRHFDAKKMRPLIQHELSRTRNIASSQINHFAMATGELIRPRLGEIRVPTLILHGEDDPVFPLGHAQAMAREIPDAHLVVLKETGHLVPRAVWRTVVPAILSHTAHR